MGLMDLSFKLISSAFTQLSLKGKMDATPRFIYHSSPVNNVLQASLYLASSQVVLVEAWGEIRLQEEERSCGISLLSVSASWGGSLQSPHCSPKQPPVGLKPQPEAWLLDSGTPTLFLAMLVFPCCC